MTTALIMSLVLSDAPQATPKLLTQFSLCQPFVCLSAVLNGSSHSPTSLNGAPSTPNGFSNGPAMSSTASLSNQQLPPACGARQLCKLKRFLTTLQQFGNDISPEIGERVRSLVLGLVVCCDFSSCKPNPMSLFCHIIACCHSYFVIYFTYLSPILSLCSLSVTHFLLS